MEWTRASGEQERHNVTVITVGSRYYSLYSVSSSFSHATLEQPFRTLAIKGEVYIFIKKSSLVFLLHCFVMQMSIQYYNALAFICLYFALPDTRVFNSLEELYIIRVAAIISFAKVLNPQEWSIYIVIHRQTVLLYHNSSVRLDTQDASNWDWNPPNFTLDLVSWEFFQVIVLLHGWTNLTKQLGNKLDENYIRMLQAVF